MKNIISIVLILLIASFFRFYALTKVPPSASLDEVSNGYNTYSILKTTTDEYGTKFPLLLRAYDDWRPALYVYFVMPFIQFFGVNVLAVRMPSVIFSVLTVLASYYVSKELLKDLNHPISAIYFELTPYISALLLAVSPWQIYISRLGHEVNIGLAFTVFTVFFMLKFINSKNTIQLFFGMFFSVLALYSYQSQKAIIPIIIISFGVIYWRELKSRFKQVTLISMLGIIMLMPLIVVSLTPDALLRLRGTSAFSPDDPLIYEHTRLAYEATQKGDVIGRILHSKKVVFTQKFIKNYLSHFHPKWLFTGEAKENHKVPFMGLLYIWELPFVIIGIILLSKLKISQKLKLFIFVWFLSSPVPGAFTTQSPHAMRSFTFLPVFQIFSGLGIVYFLHRFPKSKALTTGFCILFIISIWQFYNHYFLDFPKLHSSSFQYALSKAIPYIKVREDKYDKIIISNRDSLYQSYMFYLFYNSFDPNIYQQLGGTISGGYAQNHIIGKYEFRPIDWNTDKLLRKTLLVGNYQDFQGNANTLAIFENFDGTKAIMAVGNP